MLDYNELKNQIDSVVNNEPQDNADADQIDAIAETIKNLPGFNLTKGDNLDSVDEDVFWDIVGCILGGQDYTPATEDEWREEN